MCHPLREVHDSFATLPGFHSSFFLCPTIILVKKFPLPPGEWCSLPHPSFFFSERSDPARTFFYLLFFNHVSVFHRSLSALFFFFRPGFGTFFIAAFCPRPSERRFPLDLWRSPLLSGRKRLSGVAFEFCFLCFVLPSSPLSVSRAI